MTKIDPSKKIIIKQQGFYYNVSGNDALILNKYLGYKLYGINVPRTGFPVNGMQTVLDKIDALGMNYEVYSGKNKLITSKKFPHNTYEILDIEDFFVKKTNKTKIEKEKLSKNKQLENYIETLQALSEGINPNTGEIISGINIELKQIIFEMVMYFDTKLKNNIKKTTDYPNGGEPWTIEEDIQLTDEFKQGLSLKELSSIHKRTKGAIESRLQKLNLK